MRKRKINTANVLMGEVVVYYGTAFAAQFIDGVNTMDYWLSEISHPGGTQDTRIIALKNEEKGNTN